MSYESNTDLGDETEIDVDNLEMDVCDNCGTEFPACDLVSGLCEECVERIENLIDE